MERNLIKDLNNITKDLIMEDTFYGLFISSIEKVPETRIPLAAIGLDKSTMNFKLMINPDEWYKEENGKPVYSWENHKAILKHEIMHITFFHLVAFDFMKNKDMANVATDIEINQKIGKDKLPSWGCFIEDFKKKYPKLDWKEHAGSNHYYNELDKLPEDEKQSLGISDKAKHKWIIVGVDGKPAKLTEAEMESVRVEIENRIQTIHEEVIKSGGSVSSEISDLIKGFKKPKPKVNYLQYIRNFALNSDRYNIKFSRFKENQRFYGQPKTKLKPKNRIVVFFDQSGSVHEPTFKIFSNEIFHLKKYNDVTIYPFDTKVMSEIKIKGDTLIRRACGGTEPLCCLEFFEKSNFTTAIIYTDGHFNEIRQSQKNVLWVIDPMGTLENVTNQQRVIKLPND